MRDKLLRWCREQDLFSPGEPIVCALSGGADSVALLHLLQGLRQELSLDLRAAHYNHHLRGAESDRDQAFAEALCRDWDIPLYLSGGDVAEEARSTGKSVEEAARSLRYAWFSSLPGLVATAHNADDNLETVLLNLLRGTGLKGLCGIPPRRENLIRPLLWATRQEIDRYLTEQELPHVEDSTNASDLYLRNRLRHQVLPLLYRENPSLAATVLRSGEILRQEDAYLHAQAQDALEAAQQAEGWSVTALVALPRGLRQRALRLLLEAIHAPKLSQRHVLAVEDLLFSPSPSAKTDLPGGWQAVRQYELLRLRPKAPDWAWGPVVLHPGVTHIPALGLRITCRIEKNLQNPLDFQNSPSTFAVRCDMMEAANFPVLRPRQTGDQMRRSGGVRSLKRLFADRKIPALQRGLVPVLADSRGVLAVYGIGVNLDHRAAAGEAAWIVQIEPEKENEEKEEHRYDQ